MLKLTACPGRVRVGILTGSARNEPRGGTACVRSLLAYLRFPEAGRAGMLLFQRPLRFPAVATSQSASTIQKGNCPLDHKQFLQHLLSKGQCPLVVEAGI